MQEQRIDKYNKYVVAEDFLLVTNYNTVMEFPFFLRAVINTTSKEYLIEKKQSINALAASFLLSGQRTIPTRARKSIAGFKLRKGAVIGCRTTLRRKGLYTILDKLLIFVLPRLYSEKKNETFFKTASLLFLKKSSETIISLQTQQKPVAKTNFSGSFFDKRNFNLDQGRTKRTKDFEVLSQQERSFLTMHLSTLKRGYINNVNINEKTTSKSPIYHLSLGIKDLLLMPELQEFLPLFETVRGINIGVSFFNPRIKGTFLTATRLSSKQKFVWQDLVPYFASQSKTLATKALKDSTHSHNLLKEKNNIKESKRRLFDIDQIAHFFFIYNPVERKETKDKVILSFETNAIIKTYGLFPNARTIKSNLKGSTYKKKRIESCNLITKEECLETESINNSQKESISIFSNKKESLLKKAKCRIAQKQKTESNSNKAKLCYSNSAFNSSKLSSSSHTFNTFCLPSDTSHSKEDRKIFFLSCFQYPRKYN